MTDQVLRVAVLGDSTMWGQGLAREDTFARLAARRIAREERRTLVLAPFSARSGAKLEAARTPDRDRRVTLPSGATRTVPDGDRYRFYDTYPALFATDHQADAFLSGHDESMVRNLCGTPNRAACGEVPAVFPTITYQLGRVDAARARRIDLLIIDGGVDGGIDEAPDRIDRAVRRFAYERTLRMLDRARATFPRAVIAVTGYYSPFSAKTDHDQLVAMVKHMSDRPGWRPWLNDVLTHDVDEVVRRSQFAHTRGLYWMRRAVTEVAGASGPGIFFVHPGFRPENSLFADGTPFLHEGYRAPGDGRHEVRDVALDARTAAIPRIGRLPELRRAVELTNLVGVDLRGPTRERVLRELAGIRDSLDGPTSMLARLTTVIEDGAGRSRTAVHDAVSALNREIGRIEVSLIASFLHPNEAGARRYADRIVARHARHRETSLRRDLTRIGADPMSVRTTLRRYGLRPEAGLRAALRHMVVDVLAVEIEADPLGPGPIPFPLGVVPMFLRVAADRRYRIDGPVNGLGVVDTYGDLHLGDIDRLVLEADGPPVFRLRSFGLSINGTSVFASTEATPLKAVAFGYPLA